MGIFSKGGGRSDPGSNRAVEAAKKAEANRLADKRAAETRDRNLSKGHTNTKDGRR